MASTDALDHMFNASSIAVVGASSEAGKVGYSVVKNLVDGGFRGRVYPVNPTRASARGGPASGGGDQLFGLPYFPRLVDIPGPVDTAVIVIPAGVVNDAIVACGEKGVATAVIITSGYAEMGNAELQAELVQTARRAGVRVLGPNIFGFYYPHNDLCATFCTPCSKRGGVAFTCQSGGVGMAVIGFTRSKGIGVSAIVGLGNKVDIAEHDLLAFFGRDANTRVIAMHMEDLKDGTAFVAAAREVSHQKPVIAFKTGRTPLGSRAAASHTGALAGIDRIYDAAFRKAGVLRARTLDELLDWARALAVLPPPQGPNVFVHTSAGGLGVAIADAIFDHGLQAMEVPADLEEALRKHIPPFGSFRNPVDVTGSSTPDVQAETARLAIEDPRVHSVILGYWHTIITPPMVFAEAIGRVVEQARAKGVVKPIVASLSGDVEVEEAARYLEERGIPTYPYAPERAVSALAALHRWSRAAGVLAEQM